jgi:hypothetical protein
MNEKCCAQILLFRCDAFELHIMFFKRNFDNAFAYYGSPNYKERNCGKDYTI